MLLLPPRAQTARTPTGRGEEMSDSISTARFEAASVDAKRGSPLPENTCGDDKALAFLQRVERCCVESRCSAEIERAVAELSSLPGSSIAPSEGENGAVKRDHDHNNSVCAHTSGDDNRSAVVGLSSAKASDAAIISADEKSKGDNRDESGAIEEFLGPLRQNPAAAKAALSACRAALRLCRGEYEELLQETALFRLSGTVTAAAADASPRVDEAGNADSQTTIERHIRALVTTFVVGTDSKLSSESGDRSQEERPPVIANSTAGEVSTASVGAGTDPAVWRAAEAMWAGAAALSLFFQENYTGPELGPARIKNLEIWFARRLGLSTSPTESGAESDPTEERKDRGEIAPAGRSQDCVNVALSCDGELPYPKSGIPGSLLTARRILAFLAMSTAGCAPLWSDNPAAVKIADKQQQAAGSNAPGESAMFAAARSLSTATWWSARACVSHARLLLSADRSETLWREALALFWTTVKLFGGGVSSAADLAGSGGINEENGAVMKRRVAGQVWLEWGLAQHYFQVCLFRQNGNGMHAVVRWIRLPTCKLSSVQYFTESCTFPTRS